VTHRDADGGVSRGGGLQVSEPGGGVARRSAQVVETHISVLVFVGDHVYKLRKAVHHDVLDFTTAAAREEDCRREVQLNRRLADDVYLGVADLVLGGQTIDHVVVMRALPAERRLSTVVRGDDADRWLAQVAEVLAAFHARAARSPEISEAATPAAVDARWREDFAGTTPFVGSVLDGRRDREIRILARQWVKTHGGLLDSRIAAGAVCDGHGDLQAEDIFCLDDGVRILDCIEFSDQLRYGDVCADVAFLAMDLERLGFDDAAERFVRHYEASAHTTLPVTLLHHDIARRAYVRAKVACLRAAQGHGDAEDDARALHDLAASHLRQAGPVLVLVGGLPGTGKSTLAAGLAAETGWALLRSDELRDELVPRPAAPPETRYAPESIQAVYDELLARARSRLAAGTPVVADASWLQASTRQAARRAAAEIGAEVAELCCVCDDATASSRLVRRRAEGIDASEATPAIHALLAARADPWPQAGVLDTSAQDAGTTLALALALLGG
jgi:uncharacterized protein